MRQRTDLVFSMHEYERRLTALRQRMARHELDALVVTGPENITYLTGYQTTGYYYFQALVVPVADDPFMVTRLMEETNIDARTWVEQSRPYSDIEDPIQRLADAMRHFQLDRGRIGYDKSCYFFRATEQERFASHMSEADLVPAIGLVEEGRVIKSEEEIGLMRRAATATEAGMAAAVDAIELGVSENDVAAALHDAMYRAGGEYPACPPFVVSGPRCAIGHATWEGRTIGAGEFVFLEIGGCVQRYHTAMMRTVFLGQPRDVVFEAEHIVKTALEEAMKAMKPGAVAQDVDAITRRIIEDNEFGAVQVTRSGYSIGVAYAPDWGEGHIFSLLPENERPLEKNMVFHVIPWIRVPGELAAVGVSETVQVTPQGGRSLFSFDRKLFVKPV